jgi:glycosyltransferase involved in cell wall biosynthesis
VLTQGMPELEILMVDDGSTDGTRELAARYGDRVTYLEQHNQGPAAARNRGIAAARGEWIAFLDSDDLWLPGKVATEMALFARYPEADAIISDCDFWRDGQRVAGSHFAEMGVQLFSGREITWMHDLPPRWTHGSLFSLGALVARRAALDRLGPPWFDPGLRYGEDWEFEMRLYHHCRVALCPQIFNPQRRFATGREEEDRFIGTDAHRRALHWLHYHLLRRAGRMPWESAEIRRALHEARRHNAHQLAFARRGWQRLINLILCCKEIGEGDWQSAAVVLKAALIPRRGSPVSPQAP